MCISLFIVWDLVLSCKIKEISTKKISEPAAIEVFFFFMIRWSNAWQYRFTDFNHVFTVIYIALHWFSLDVRVESPFAIAAEINKHLACGVMSKFVTRAHLAWRILNVFSIEWIWIRAEIVACWLQLEKTSRNPTTTWEVDHFFRQRMNAISVEFGFQRGHFIESKLSLMNLWIRDSLFPNSLTTLET